MPSFKELNFNTLITKYADVLLAVGVIIILSMIMVVLPTWLVDILLAINLCLSFTILLVALNVQEPLRIASFPTILLITTLFRLALNISSTRLILSQGHAGDVIDTFANLVTGGGNFVVGTIIFLIITLVNFLVIAKGAERVSEVAARFTLDAMPGKQMSIDADLRAGTITMEQAQERRSTLQRESQMYGSMDGAMKFVKGDAIAGIVITIINVIAGLIIGVMQEGKAPLEALAHYSNLSIGDGLVSMLPAFIISLSAGIVVTRVASEKKETNLGNDMLSQLTAYPKIFLILSGLFFLLGFAFGLYLAFWTLSALMLAFGWYKSRKKTEAVKKVVDQPKEEKIKKAIEKKGDQLPFILPSPISLEVGSAIIPFVDDSKDGGRFINELIPLLRHGLYYEIGVNFPGVQVRGQTVDMESEAYVININEVPVARGKVKQGAILIGEPLEQLQLFNIQGVETIHPIDGSIVTWVSEEYKEVCIQAGFRMWDIAEYMILHLSYVLRKHAHEFLGLQEIQTLLNELERTHPALVKELVPKVITVLQLSEIFQRLVQEEIAIRDLKNIFSTLAQWAEIERNTLMLTEHIRAGLKRYVTHKYAGHSNSLAVYLLDPGIEEMIRDAIRTTEKGNYLALDPEITQEIIESVGKEIASHPFPPGAKPPVILTTADIRRYFRKIVELEFPQLSVLSYQELSENLRIQPISRVSIPRIAEQASA